MTATTPTFTRADLIKARQELVRSRGEVAQLRKQLAETEQALTKARASRAVSETDPCPHCGQAYAAGTGLAQHVRSCAKRADKASRRDEELASAKARATNAEKRVRALEQQLVQAGAGGADEALARARRAEQRARGRRRCAGKRAA